MSTLITTVAGNHGKAPMAILWAPKGEHPIKCSLNGLSLIHICDRYINLSAECWPDAGLALMTGRVHIRSRRPDMTLDFKRYCFERATKMRQTIKFQVGILDEEYRCKDMPAFKIKGLGDV